MNSLGHVFINFFFLHFFVDVGEYFWAIIIFSVVLDIDHVPGVVRYAFFMTPSQKKNVKVHHYYSLFRTAIQEPVGILLLLIMLASLSWLGVGNNELLAVAATCLVLHWVVDFFTVHTQPFTPISKHSVIVFLRTHKQRTLWEVYGTLFFGALAFFFVFL